MSEAVDGLAIITPRLFSFLMAVTVSLPYLFIIDYKSCTSNGELVKGGNLITVK